MKENILLIEDEEILQSALSTRLRGQGYIVDTASNGVDGFDKAITKSFDLIILDIMLPDRSGFDVCRDIRRVGMATPILFLTARQQMLDQVLGLKLGGDDYVTKPFKAAELMARVEVLLRRVPIRYAHGVHQYGHIRLDMGRSVVTRDDKPVELSNREFQLLRYLIERSGSAIPRGELLRAVWGLDENTLTRTVDNHVANLRDKIEENPKHPELIITVTGVGYKFMGSRSS